MKSLVAACATLALTVLAAPAAYSAVITSFSDNFDSEASNGALNYTSFANFTVTAGSVDLIPHNGNYDFYPGNGLYVDLDGTTGGQNPAGQITTNDVFAAGTYSVSFYGRR